MLNILKIDHIGIRVREKDRSINFYQSLGFEVMNDYGFEQGAPVIMQHTSGVVLNILGPSSEQKDENILMDIDKSYAGYTHMALRVSSIADTEKLFEEKSYIITEHMSYKDISSVFIRDPDKNVIELTAYNGSQPDTRTTAPKHS